MATTKSSELLRAGAAVGLIAALARFAADVYELRYPKPYVELRTGEIHRETRPLSDVLMHTVIFRWIRLLVGDGWLFQLLLARLNRKVLDWDVPFEKLGKDPATEVESFCRHWGVPLAPWPWSKAPAEYLSANDFFTRDYAFASAPEQNLGNSLVVSPATAVVTWFESAQAMPKVLKNDAWRLHEVGLPDFEAYENHPAAMMYLAPADYHCYHSPIAGKLLSLGLLDQHRYSVTVKPYIFSSVNILTRNRRAVAVIQSDERPGLRVAVVIVGGVTVDSIRLDPSLSAGAAVKKGQRLGAFARGGSAIALLFSGPVELDATAQALAAAGRDFKIEVARSLAA